jgi:pyruvoyl-dependent arginine decarboxylase (PvlArgDC)
MNKNLRNVLKAFMLLVCFSFFQNETNAQTFDNGIFFQALARDNYSNPAKDRKIYVQSTIIQSTINGTKVLVEEYQTTTDATGVFGISIGKGTRTGGSLSALNNIDWSAGPYFLNLKISITPVAPLESWNYSKDWVDLGTTSFGTVPYALYAKSVAGFDTKVNVSDTAKMLLPYAKAQALTLVQNAVNTKLNTTDSVVAYVTPTQLTKTKVDTTSLSNRINLKATTSNLATVATSGSYNDLINRPTGLVSSVGNVKSSSDPNGATIAAGVLSLTPADGTNGGIVTNAGQYFAGEKTFKENITVHYGTDGTTGIRVGVPNGGALNTMLGTASFLYGTPGDYNTAIGGFTLSMLDGGGNNTAVGVNALRQSANGVYNGNRNTAIGSAALSNGLSASDNVAIGVEANRESTGSYNAAVGNFSQRSATTGANNTSIGYNSLYRNTTGNNNTAIGNQADVATNNLSNATAIGNGALVSSSNSIQLGNTSVTNVKTSGNITAGAITYPNTAGTSGQVLTTNGSVATWVAPSTITVGTISNTSNVNGATISAGVLSLAPANASYGGIVTTGAQTFAGNKTFSGNIVVNTVTNPATKDVDNFVGIIGTIGATQWQSFVAGQSGSLTKITLSGNGSVGARNGTLIIFAGTGISGTQLSSQTVALPPSSGSYDLVLTSPVNLISGQTYTFEVIDPIGYPSGNASFGGAALISGTSYYSNAYGLNPSTSSYSWGLQFQTWISTTSGGNLSTTGAITTGNVTYPNTNGTAGQVLTANSNGQASWTSVSGGSGPQIVTTSQRDALNTTTSGVMIFNSTLNKYQGSIYYTTGYNYNNFTSTIYGFSEVRPGYSLAQTFTGKGQVITSANIAVVNMGRVSNTGTFTFAIYDDTYNYPIYSTTITLTGAGTVAVTIPNNYMNMPRTLPNGPCSIRISSDASTGGSADFLLNAGASIGSLSNTYWSSLGGTAAGYTTPDTGHQLAIDLLPQNGLTWVSFN